MAPIIYGNLAGWFLYLDIHNDRPDIAALECTAKLFEYGPSGDTLRPSPIRSPLKATGQPGFSHTIFPQSHEAFDLLCIGTDTANRGQRRAYLNSALDVVPTRDLGIMGGAWNLRYQFFAIEFPILTVAIELILDGGLAMRPRILEQEAR